MKKSHPQEQIVRKLREAKAELAAGGAAVPMKNHSSLLASSKVRGLSCLHWRTVDQRKMMELPHDKQGL
jgi:hypothetical protein